MQEDSFIEQEEDDFTMNKNEALVKAVKKTLEQNSVFYDGSTNSRGVASDPKVVISFRNYNKLLKLVRMRKTC